MYPIKSTALKYFFDKYNKNPSLRFLQSMAQDISPTEKPGKNIDKLIEIYEKSIPLIEKEIWNNDSGESNISRFQKVFQEMEVLISLKGEDDRYEFILVVPVADRPQHLQSCLNSLLELCRNFNYGGYSNKRYNKVSVIIADDSKEKENRKKNKKISTCINSKGIPTLYFGLADQLHELESFSEKERDELVTALGNKETASSYHKGPSLMRNIAYLKLAKIAKNNEKILFYFIDSDQEFKIQVNTAEGDKDLLAINYFYELDRVFTQSDASILTGKVVGDPPVSPSVMAGNYLDDIICFMRQMGEADPDESCRFHNMEHRKDNGATYHDMADLFGYMPTDESYHYNCDITGPHDNSACFHRLSSKLNNFFFGEHPTRRTYFVHEDVLDSMKSARTVYTGNYIFKSQALKYCIPFATLKLRMAGPVLGRIIKSDIGARFVSANLPVLHKRIVRETGKSDFRPGVSIQKNVVDLSGEFERQFFGDVMLFTIEQLTDMGYPDRTFSWELVEELSNTIERKIYMQYAEKHTEIVEKIKVLNSIVGNKEVWWNKLSGLKAAKESWNIFLRNIERNFGVNAICYDLIGSVENRNKRMQEIVQAIMTYSDDRKAWENALLRVRLRVKEESEVFK